MAQQATTQLLESTSCRARWCREKGEERRGRRREARAESLSPQPQPSERVFFSFFPSSSIVGGEESEHLPSPRRCQRCSCFVIHGGARTATISGSQWETELPMTVLLRREKKEERRGEEGFARRKSEAKRSRQEREREKQSSSRPRPRRELHLPRAPPPPRKKSKR